MMGKTLFIFLKVMVFCICLLMTFAIILCYYAWYLILSYVFYYGNIYELIFYSLIGIMLLGGISIIAPLLIGGILIKK